VEQENISKNIHKRIEEYDRNLDRWTHYEMLYVTRDADNAAIKRSYRKLVQLMHPDRYGYDLDPDYKEKLERIFNEINIAYNVLLDETERARYDQSLYRAEDHGEPLKEESEILVAKAQYGRGIKALKQGEVVPAIEFFKSAIKLSPGIPEYYAKLAYALSKHPLPRVKTEAFAACKEAVKLDHENPNYHALMGYLRQQTGDIESAEVHYRRALSWDPHHHRAREELKNILFEKSQKKKSKKLLTKITSFLTATPIQSKDKKSPPAHRRPPKKPS